MHAVLKDEPTIPADAKVPAWLQQVVLRGLRKRPGDRWPSMQALLSALAFDPVARARSLRRAALAVSVVTASVVGFGWLAVAARERAGEEAAAKVAAEAARDEAFAGLRTAAERSEAEASRARDALRVAALRRFDNIGAIDHVDDPTSSVALLREVEAPEQLRGWRLAAVDALEQPIAKLVLPGWDYVGFTPDGQHVVTQNGNESASVWRTDGTGTPVTLGSQADGWLGAVALSPDGRHVALGYNEGLVRLHAIDGTGAPIDLRGPGHQVTGLRWRDDSSGLLVNAWDKQPGVTIVRSQLWQVNEPGASWLDFPGEAAFMPASGRVFARGNRSESWGPLRHASVRQADGTAIVEFPDALRLEPSPAGDSLLVIGERALQRRGLDGGKLGAPLDHAALLGADETLATATFTPNGARVISTTSEDRVFVWDVDAGKLLREVDAPPRPQAGMLQWGLGLALSPDSRLMARGYADRTVRVWDVEGEHAPMILRGHLHAPHELAFSPDSRTLASTTLYVRGFSKTEGLQRERGDFDYTIRLWPMPTARTTQFPVHSGPNKEADLRWVSHSPWVPEGRDLVLNEGLKLRRVDAAGELLAAVTVPDSHEYLREPICAADGGSVVYESANAWVRWDLREPSRLESFTHPAAEQRAVKAQREHGKGWSNLSRDGQLVYYVAPAGDAVRIYRFGTHELVRQLDHDAKVERVEFSPQGDRIMTVTKERRVRVWSTSGDAPPELFAAEGEGLVYALWSPDSRLLVVCVATGKRDEYAFHVWRAGEAEAQHRLTTTTALALARVSPDGEHLALVGTDDRVRLVSLAGALRIRELDAVDSEPGKLEFSRDGAWLLSAASNAAFVWSTSTGQIVRVLRSPQRQLSLASFDASASSLLLGDREGLVTIVPFDAELARADLRTRLRAATSYCYSYARRRVDLHEPAALAWATYAACERDQGREPGTMPDAAGP